MNNALGQYGIGGRLGDSIRERQGMAYYVFSSFDANVVEGPLIVRAGVNPANVDRAIASIDEEMRRMAAEGMTPRRARRLQAVLDRFDSAAARNQRRHRDVSADRRILRPGARPRSPTAVAARCCDARRRERRRAHRRSTSTAPSVVVAGPVSTKIEDWNRTIDTGTITDVQSNLAASRAIVPRAHEDGCGRRSGRLRDPC